MLSNTAAGASPIPPTRRSRSDSLTSPPVTNASLQDDRARDAAVGRVGEDDLRGAAEHRRVGSLGAERLPRGWAAGTDAVAPDLPCSSLSTTGEAMSSTAVRRCTPATALSPPAEAEPDGRVVVAAPDHERDARLGERDEGAGRAGAPRRSAGTTRHRRRPTPARRRPAARPRAPQPVEEGALRLQQAGLHGGCDPRRQSEVVNQFGTAPSPSWRPRRGALASS